MVGSSIRWLVRVGWCALWLLAFQAGCSSSSGGAASCTARCSDLCQALAACGAPPADCEAQCTLGLGTNCSGPPADQLTCNELNGKYACADYCATLCTRAPDCGSFEQSACARGCASQDRPTCNSKSVAARTCDQLKPELRLYQDAGNAGPGEHVIGGGFGAAYGLCETADDCAETQGCSTDTNTCAVCQTDADCDHGYLAYACEAGACQKVGCVKDADCYGGKFCETTLHVCGECHSNADCPSAWPICSPVTAQCVQCVTSSDCTDPILSHCDEALSFCSLCKTDADCAGRKGTPVCDVGCVECKTNADCSDPEQPTCEAHTCR